MGRSGARLASLFVVVFSMLIVGLPLAALAQSGEIIKVTQPARLFLDGQRSTLELGDTVNVGETIVTGSGAEVQIVFSDETRIVVGPNSQLKIDELLFNSNTSAKRFAVSAAKGTFRFLSGKSSNSAYSVRTPIATMGVRGTAFDFAVPAQDNTDLVVHDGEVRFCRRGVTACARVPSGCQTVRMQSRQLTQPETRAERRAILGEVFPYAVNQASLRTDFHTAIETCEGNDAQALTQIDLPSISLRQVPQEGPQPSEGGGNPAE
jgi:hypothetical protein